MDLIRVFLADDHKMFIRGLSRVFNEDPDLDLIGSAPDGRTAVEAILGYEPDIAVLDISMPKLSGFQVLSTIRQGGSSTRVLLLTGTESQDSVYQAVSLGARGYLLKTADWDDLVTAIKKIHAGDTVIDPEAMKLLAGQIQQGDIGLTKREREVLTKLAQGYSSPDIAAQLRIQTFTVKGYIKNLYKKLGVSSRAAAVAEAMRRNLIE